MHLSCSPKPKFALPLPSSFRVGNDAMSASFALFPCSVSSATRLKISARGISRRCPPTLTRTMGPALGPAPAPAPLRLISESTSSFVRWLPARLRPGVIALQKPQSTSGMGWPGGGAGNWFMVPQRRHSCSDDRPDELEAEAAAKDVSAAGIATWNCPAQPPHCIIIGAPPGVAWNSFCALQKGQPARAVWTSSR